MNEFDLIHRSLDRVPLEFHDKAESKRISSFIKKRRWANGMKHQPTKGESAMWLILKPFTKRKFRLRRQYVLFGFIADFAFLNSKIIVEVDGSSHNGKEDYDKQRDEVFKHNGWRTLRFTNEQTLSRDPSITTQIKSALNIGLPSKSRLKKPDSTTFQRFLKKQREHEDEAQLLRMSR
jgi:very-short-patch-repair endonuclease